MGGTVRIDISELGFLTRQDNASESPTELALFVSDDEDTHQRGLDVCRRDEYLAVSIPRFLELAYDGAAANPIAFARDANDGMYIRASSRHGRRSTQSRLRVPLRRPHI